MAFESADFAANIAAAAGEDAALREELLVSFRESMEAQVDLLKRARCDGNWNVAANRLRGLGSSFHAGDLVILADEALDSAPGDPVVVRKLEQFCREFSSCG